MFKLAIVLLFVLEPLLSLARPQYFCAFPCPWTKPCNPGSRNSYRCANSNCDCDDPCGGGCDMVARLELCCPDNAGGNPTSTTTPPPTTTHTTTTTPPQGRSGEDYRRSQGGRRPMLTGLCSIPGAVADAFLSGELNL